MEPVASLEVPVQARPLRDGMRSMRTWPARRWLVAVLAGVLAALLIGVPTGVVETSLYTRMTPVRWWDYPVWALSAALVGLTAATYVRRPQPLNAELPDRAKQTVGAGLLSAFAVGCPVCNKLVVGLIGVSGALSYWAPLQPVLAVAALAVLAAGLAVRIRGEAVCAAPRV